MKKRPLLDRFLDNLIYAGDCIAWGGALTKQGYGQLYNGVNGPVYAHRIAYQYYIGPIPEGLVIDHLCRNRACVNPSHLRVVTHRENILAPTATGFAARHARKTHCPQGHPYSAENVRIRRPSNQRVCRTCHRNRERQRGKALAEIEQEQKRRG